MRLDKPTRERLMHSAADGHWTVSLAYTVRYGKARVVGTTCRGKALVIQIPDGAHQEMLVVPMRDITRFERTYARNGGDIKRTKAKSAQTSKPKRARRTKRRTRKK